MPVIVYGVRYGVFRFWVTDRVGLGSTAPVAMLSVYMVCFAMYVRTDMHTDRECCRYCGRCVNVCVEVPWRRQFFAVVEKLLNVNASKVNRITVISSLTLCVSRPKMCT